LTLGQAVKTKNSWIAFLILMLPFSASARYDRALVFQGGGFQTAIYLGILDGVRSQGFNPDVVISTCGSSLSSAVINAFPKPEDQRAFIESERFYELVKNIGFTKESHLFEALALDYQIRRDASRNVVPDIFRKFLLTLSQDFGIQEFDQSFPTKGMRAVMVSAGVNFTEQDAGKPRNGADWFTETFFTDQETAALLKGFESPIALTYPNTSITRATNAVTSVSLGDAARASISDPFYMKPKQIGDSNYVTGAVDLYPNEVAHTLASEVAEVFSDGFDTIVEEPTIKATFHFDDNERLRAVGDMYADYWVDMSDFGSFNNKDGLNPALKLLKFKLESRVPSTYAEYVERVEAEWNYGKERGSEAILMTEKNDKAHIRNLSKSNSSAELRAKYKKK
jgi:hypothetical protein